MHQFTQPEQELLLHLLAGGKVTDSTGDICHFNSLQLCDEEYLDIKVLLDECTMILSDDQLRIIELEKLLKTQGEELQKALQQKKVTVPRKSRSVITQKEVTEIETMIMKGIVDLKLIMSTYELSQASVSRINTGHHTLSSLKYIAWERSGRPPQGE